jgi:hypothetical protein
VEFLCDCPPFFFTQGSPTLSHTSNEMYNYFLYTSLYNYFPAPGGGGEGVGTGSLGGIGEASAPPLPPGVSVAVSQQQQLAAAM